MAFNDAVTKVTLPVFKAQLWNITSAQPLHANDVLNDSMAKVIILLTQQQSCGRHNWNDTTLKSTHTFKQASFKSWHEVNGCPSFSGMDLEITSYFINEYSFDSC